ncbi:MAG: WhiB family transcriptional regulator [Actinomycetaceae bacterium]
MTTQLTAYQPSIDTTATSRPAAVQPVIGFGLVSPSADEVSNDELPCLTAEDPDLWFAEHTAEVERAKAACRTCPLLESCLEGALERAEPWGVWGGQVFVDGVVVATKRGRGRPRKNAAA